MNISIWNKITKKWIPVTNVKNIYQSREYFEINFNSPKAKKYDTEKYELTFIHSSYPYSIRGKTCPLWENLPNHDCSECPNANEDCIMLG